MRLTLITVSYNSEETIRETFESVRSQKLKGFNLEYIHVDGLSKDKTIEISQEYDDIITKRISEKDLGIYNAMNKGIELATGDIIGFLNSDDTFSSSEILLNVCNQFIDDSNLDIVYGDINYVNESGKIKRKWITGKRKSFRKGWHPAHPGFYAKRNLFYKHGGFDEKLRIAADFDLMLRFIEVAESKVKYLPFVFVNMKLGGESNKSFSNIWESYQNYKESFMKYGIKPRRFYIVYRWCSKLLQMFR